jgi:hypothetical protein
VIAVLGGMMGLRASEMATLTVEALGTVRAQVRTRSTAVRTASQNAAGREKEKPL